jgi:[protein-PII] uridylyltransferase
VSSDLHAQREALEKLWKQGLSGHELLLRHTEMVDAFIIDHFTAAPAVQKARGSIAVVALGGYGRRELYPYSDVDLLLLHDWKAKKYMQDVSEAILYPLWDAGFDVGHSVRGVKDAVSFAANDFIFLVSLLDARLLTGSEVLYDKLLARYQKKILDGRRHEFVRTMDRMRGERRKKYGSHSYLLEPHIKEGKGGMRDIQAMLWTAKAIFGLSGLAAMEESGMLEPAVRRDFEQSWNMLARIRNRLHYISRRHNDQLIFEYQEEMAAAFGYEDRDGMLAVEHFMRHVYSHLQTIAVVTDLFFEHVHEVLGLIDKDQGERELEKGIVVRSSTLRLAVTEDELHDRPLLLMRLFLQAARTGLPIHHRSRQLVTRNLHLVDDGFRTSRRIARIFLELLMQAKTPMATLETMLETGLLPAYIPEFGGVESLAQHDLYHIYTVDRHQLQTVAELVALREPEADLYLPLSTPHLLYLAALLHDIGKGHHTDHSRLGSEMIVVVGQRLGLEKEECSCLSFLVRYHLYLPENALRRDLDDQEFIRQAAELIGDMDRLTMLYLLTIADSRATGPSAWSSWKATLLVELYLKVKACLEAGCTVEIDDHSGEEQGVSWLREQVQARLDPGEAVRMPVQELPADYLMSFTPEMVVRHLRMHHDQATLLAQKVLLFPEDRHGSWSLLMLSRDRQGLLAKLCGVLALHNLSVLAAQIFTWPDGTVVDVLDVVPVADSGFEEQNWPALEDDLNLAVNYRLDVGLKLHSKLQSAGNRPRRQVQQLERKVVIDNDSSARFTVIEVYGGDRPGTLYQLTQTLSDFSLSIHRARIATEVEQLIDIFYVSTADGAKVTDSELIDKITRTLLYIIGEGEDEGL